MQQDMEPVARLGSLFPYASEEAFSEFQLKRPAKALLENKWEDLTSLLELPKQKARRMILWVDSDTFLMGTSFDVLRRPRSVSCEVHISAKLVDHHSPASNVFLYGPTPEHLTEPLQVLLQMLAQSQHSNEIAISGPLIGARSMALPVSNHVLEQFLGQAHWREIRFQSLAFGTEQCQALTGVGEHVHLVLDRCELGDQGLELARAIRRNHGPTRLTLQYCMPLSGRAFRLFTVGLAVNTRMKLLKLHMTGLLDRQVAALSVAVGENHGLVSLSLNGNFISNDNRTRLLQSVERHVTLKELDLRQTGGGGPRQTRTRTIAQMLKTNKVLTKIHLSDLEHDVRIIEHEIRPRQVINEFRPQVHAVANETTPLASVLLGGALRQTQVQQNPNLLCMFLQENTDLLLDHRS